MVITLDISDRFLETKIPNVQIVGSALMMIMSTLYLRKRQWNRIWRKWQTEQTCKGKRRKIVLDSDDKGGSENKMEDDDDEDYSDVSSLLPSVVDRPRVRTCWHTFESVISIRS